MTNKQLQITDQNLLDIVDHGIEGFPIQYYVDELYRYPKKTIPLHWHYEMEFYVAYGGDVEIQVGEHILKLYDGEAIFINANILHSFKQIGDGRCQCPNIVFSYELMSSTNSKIYLKYIEPIMTDKEIPYFILNKQSKWHKDVIALLDVVFSILQKYGSYSSFYGKFPMLAFQNKDIECICYEMETQCIINRIWQLIYAHKEEIPKTSSKKNKYILQIRTQKMLKFIHDHYSKPITLKNIANSADISISEASRCFQSYLQTSPISYLLNYRLDQAQYFLLQSRYTVTEISYMCGFQTTSYFGKMFQRKVGMTPTEYRKMNL